jgi:hypothetical protein
MDIQAEKIALAKMILDTNDEAIIDQIKSLFEYSTENSWDGLPAYVRQGVKESVAQADRGEFISLEDVKKEVSLLLNK